MTTNTNRNRKSETGTADRTWLIIFAFLGFLFLMGALIIGVAFAIPNPTNSFSIISILLGFVGTSIPVFIAAIVSVQTKAEVREVKEQVNGHLDKRLYDQGKRSTEDALQEAGLTDETGHEQS